MSIEVSAKEPILCLLIDFKKLIKSISKIVSPLTRIKSLTLDFNLNRDDFKRDYPKLKKLVDAVISNDEFEQIEISRGKFFADVPRWIRR